MSDPTKEDLLREIHRLEQELGETPTSIDMNENGEYSAGTYQYHFGGWNDALREAGLEPNQPRKISTDELLNEIRRLASKFNRTPTKSQMDDYGEYYGRSYRLRFGSWNEAVQRAGLEPNQRIPDDEFRENPETCPLCNRPFTERFDFHHWRYGENKVGCYLCRDCHDAVHADGARPEENPDWLLEAVENLTRRHEEHHDDTSVITITDRYNIPSDGIVESVLGN